jgi:hypothetical protein
VISKSNGVAGETPIRLSEKELKELAGVYYERSSGDVFQLTARDGKLVGVISGITVQFAPVSTTRFLAVDAPGPAEFEFFKLKPQQPLSLRLRIAGLQPGVYESVTRVTPTSSQLVEYSGEYFSDELNVTYSLKVEGEKLYFMLPGTPKTDLAPSVKDAFRTTGGLSFIFQRDRANRISGFVLSAGRVRNLRFVRKSN